MKKKHKFIIILIGIIFNGCYTYKSYVPFNLKDVNLELPISITKILIEDRRTDISKEDDIKLPFLSGLRRKKWKHFPRISDKHETLIKETVNQNFYSSSKINGDITVLINYASKEFEQTGVSEIERVYLDTEIFLKTKEFEYHSFAIDTFHYTSIDASNKHFEKFYQTSLQNNLVRNIAQLKSQFYKSDNIESECDDKTYKKSLIFKSGIKIIVSGKNDIDSILIDDLNSEITQIWNFKISTNQKGRLIYIESLDELKAEKKEELRKIMNYLSSIQIFEKNQTETFYCRTLIIKRNAQ
ncbi:hypothetical protein [Polaribacter uvawellassae]|uniref:hypothetical protein n=1 Tax=Polaribacter uvawellassae TaxID=3133495 RepID=UPI00321BAA49